MSGFGSPESKSRRDVQQRLRPETSGVVSVPDDSWYSGIAQLGSNVIQSNYFNGFMMVITIWALFGDDIKMLCTDRSADIVFDYIAGFALAMFCIELALFCAL